MPFASWSWVSTVSSIGSGLFGRSGTVPLEVWIFEAMPGGINDPADEADMGDVE